MTQAKGLDKQASAVDATRCGKIAIVKTHGLDAAQSSEPGSAADSSSSVIYISSERLEAALRNGKDLAEWGSGPQKYYVGILRHDKRGVAEVHLRMRHIWYVLQGSETLVTGGTVVNPKTIAPYQIRGTAIVGGKAQRLGKGDLVIIPEGVPHWTKDVQSPLVGLEINIP
ncbi:MAG TPA: hypothetical protein VMX16_12015 [Terriglobia bacterium]|nr:hypothetical protein [Terriglobia bacterium]